MATNLFNLLISNDAPTIEESVPSHEQWDSSTVSSGLDGDSVITGCLSEPITNVQADLQLGYDFFSVAIKVTTL